MKKSLIIILMLIFALGMTPNALADSISDQIAALRVKIAALKVQIEDFQKQIEDLIAIQNASLKTGDTVRSTVNLKIRSIPSTSGTILGRTLIGSKGTIRCDQQSGNICPKTADGFTWWYIDWDESLPSGWSAEGSSEAPFLEKTNTASTNAPVISSILPNFGPVGTTVTIIGSGFTALNNSINFNSSSVANVLSSNGTSLVFNVPARPAGSYGVTVANASGTSNPMSFAITAPNAQIGTVNLRATLNGAPWPTSGTNNSIHINYSYPVGSDLNISVTVPGDVSSQPTGSYTLTYVSGGPAGATFQNINGIGATVTQTLSANGVITFTFNFTSSGAPLKVLKPGEYEISTIAPKVIPKVHSGPGGIELLIEPLCATGDVLISISGVKGNKGTGSYQIFTDKNGATWFIATIPETGKDYYSIRYKPIPQTDTWRGDSHEYWAGGCGASCTSTEDNKTQYTYYTFPYPFSLRDYCRVQPITPPVLLNMIPSAVEWLNVSSDEVARHQKIFIKGLNFYRPYSVINENYDGSVILPPGGQMPRFFVKDDKNIVTLDGKKITARNASYNIFGIGQPILPGTILEFSLSSALTVGDHNLSVTTPAGTSNVLKLRVNPAPYIWGN